MDFTYKIKKGDYIEVENWPEGVKNPIIPYRSTPNERLRSAAIKISKETDYLKLHGMCIQAGLKFDVSFHTAYYLFFNGEMTFTWGLHDFESKVAYDSLDDYINNKPASRDVRVHLKSGSAVITEKTVRFDWSNGDHTEISIEDWKKVNKQVKFSSIQKALEQ